MSASSRGGGRGGGGGGRGRGGGGGGGGGGRGGARGGAAQVPMGTLTWSEFSEVDRQKPTKSYPPMDADPKVSGPSSYESKVIAYQLGYLEHQRNSLWWPVVEDRKVREVTRYSDRYQKGQAQGQQQQQQPGSTTTTTATPLSSLSLSDPSIVSTLQKDAFPTQLWNVYMNAETRQQERGKKREEMRLKGDWKKVVDSVEMGGGADRLSEGAPSDEEDEGALDEYEDDEEDDYADNYFDNGEDDDIQDEGGEGAEETYE